MVEFKHTQYGNQIIMDISNGKVAATISEAELINLNQSIARYINTIYPEFKTGDDLHRYLDTKFDEIKKLLGA